MTKTKETIWFEESNKELPEGIYPGMMDDKVYNAMQIWADQEKRSTAIAFLEYVVKNGWSNRDSLENGRIDFAELYDLFIQSLPKTV